MGGVTATRSLLLCWLTALAFWTPGCPHRTDGEIDVDAVQGYANQVERHLRSMRDALEAKDLERATDEHEEARETLADHRAALAAYPELSELEEAVGRASRTLCYHAASFALQAFYEQVRAKDLGAAREQLGVARKEHDRCKGQIDDRQDYMPLKMNLDSAPQALVDLERELARPALLERIGEAKAALEARKKAVQDKLTRLAAAPSQRELAIGIDADLKALEQQLGAQPDFGGEQVWQVYAAGLAGEIASLHQRRAGLVRRGKIRLIIDERLPAGRRLTAQAAKAKDKQAAAKMLAEAKGLYAEARQILAELIKAEPGLAKEAFRVGKNKRTGKWLLRHLARSVASVERLEKKLGRKRPAVRQKTKTQTKKKRKRGRRRVRRW